MPTLRSLNNSFVHGALAYSAYALGPFVQNPACLVLALLVCVYAGWCRQAYLAALLGGVIVAVVLWAAAGMLISPEIRVALLFMTPVALLVILPTVLAAYLVGKAIGAVARRGAGRTPEDA